MSTLLIYKGVPDQIEVGASNNTEEFHVGDIVMVIENVCCFDSVLIPAGYICRIKRMATDLYFIDDGRGVRAWASKRKLRIMHREEGR